MSRVHGRLPAAPPADHKYSSSAPGRVGRKKGRRLQACPGPDPDPLPLTSAGHIQSGSGGLAQQYWGRGEEHQALNPTAPPLPPAGLNSSAHTNGL